MNEFDLVEHHSAGQDCIDYLARTLEPECDGFAADLANPGQLITRPIDMGSNDELVHCRSQEVLLVRAFAMPGKTSIVCRIDHQKRDIVQGDRRWQWTGQD